MVARHMYRYTVMPMVEAEGGGFLVAVHDLPGCMSDGETEIEAINNVHDAIDEWIAEAKAIGRPIPEPTPFSDPITRPDKPSSGL